MLSWVDWCHQKYPQPKRQFGSLDSLSADISVGHAIAPNIKPELCSNFSGNWTARAAPPVGNPMPFLLGNLFCGLHRKSSGTKKKDAQGCGARKEVASLQFGQAGQTNCCQYQVAKNVTKKDQNSKAKTILKGQEIRRRKSWWIVRERNTAVTSFYNQTTIDQAKICKKKQLGNKIF